MLLNQPLSSLLLVARDKARVARVTRKTRQQDSLSWSTSEQATAQARELQEANEQKTRRVCKARQADLMSVSWYT